MSATPTEQELQEIYEQTLLDEVKNYLDITWADTETDMKLLGQIRRGIAYISAKTGVPASAFAGESANDRARELLFNYVLYDRAGAVDQFKKNYRSDIVGLRIKWEVSNAARAKS